MACLLDPCMAQIPLEIKSHFLNMSELQPDVLQNLWVVMKMEVAPSVAESSAPEEEAPVESQHHDDDDGVADAEPVEI